MDRIIDFLEALVSGDIRRMMKILKKGSAKLAKNWKVAIDLMVSGYELVTMKKDTFEEMINRQDAGRAN